MIVILFYVCVVRVLTTVMYIFVLAIILVLYRALTTIYAYACACVFIIVKTTSTSFSLVLVPMLLLWVSSPPFAYACVRDVLATVVKTSLYSVVFSPRSTMNRY